MGEERCKKSPMGNNNYKQILYLLGFLAFAGVSCWATQEFLHLLLPSWPVIMCWIVTIGFFVVASIGTKLIVDSTNTSIYLQGRGKKLIFGIILVLVFWLICSMPTNTHTFFYRSFINQKIETDISKTQGYLAQIKNNEVTDKLIQAKKSELENKVNIRLGELQAEIMNESNPGFGKKSKEILNSFAELLDVPQIAPLTYKGTSKQDREKLCTSYRQKIYLLMDTKKKNIELSLQPKNKEYMKVAATDYNNLELVRKYINNKTLDVNDANDIHTVCDKLNKGYTTISNYSQFVSFKNLEDKEKYIAKNPESNVRRMLSVFDVWADFIHGEFPLSFIFWVIISILVDIAAFIFFDLAFKKTEF